MIWDAVYIHSDEQDIGLFFSRIFKGFRFFKDTH